jgi:phosphoserine phosphatase RsbU/P
MNHTIEKQIILIVDDEAANISILGQTLMDEYELRVATNGTTALTIAASDLPDLILLDVMMPGLDGYEVCKKLKTMEATRNIPIIFVTVRSNEEYETKGLELGAVDYITKPFSIPIVRARVKTHMMQKHLMDQVRKSLKCLNDELAQAAKYVTSLLPVPLRDGIVRTDWRFIPSMALGGDSLGYHWIDSNHFAFYVLDVCGHGVGAALHSVSVLNLIRSQSLKETNFGMPGEVLTQLNKMFSMEKYNGMYFTIWYGVYNTTSRNLVYASAGHPPALLFSDPYDDAFRPIQLQTPNLFVGGIQDAEFETAQYKLEGPCKLYIFSDGVFEALDENGNMWTFRDFVQFMSHPLEIGTSQLDRLVAYSSNSRWSGTLSDDLSIMEIVLS